MANYPFQRIGIVFYTFSNLVKGLVLHPYPIQEDLVGNNLNRLIGEDVSADRQELDRILLISV